MDLLSQLIEHFSIRAGVFYSGHLCGVSSIKEDKATKGHLHILKSGQLTMRDAHSKQLTIDQPCVIYLPKANPHVIEGLGKGAELVCATVEYRTGQVNPLLSALPSVIVIPLSAAPSFLPVIDVLFYESGEQAAGSQFLMDKLSDAMMALIFRHLIEQQQISNGLFAGLAHPRLANVMAAIHQLPPQAHTIEELAEIALMSRTHFIDSFKLTVGETPGDYSQKWRITVAQSMLMQKKPLNWVADEVGYDSYSGFSRAFRKVTGIAPRKWLKQKHLS